MSTSLIDPKPRMRTSAQVVAIVIAANPDLISVGNFWRRGEVARHQVRVVVLETVTVAVPLKQLLFRGEERLYFITNKSVQFRAHCRFHFHLLFDRMRKVRKVHIIALQCKAMQGVGNAQGGALWKAAGGGL